ncbi:MAG: polyhydroxybutyrate depolymerase [Planctomycetota bacterium]|jgi:polyhydroxybutyrate depolymerase
MNKIFTTILLILFSISLFSQMTTYNFKFEGKDRAFNVYLPSSYAEKKAALPVVFFLHGMGGDMSNFSGLSYKAEAENYIMVIPQAMNNPKTGKSWSAGAITIKGDTYFPNANINDVGFISSLLDTVSAWYNVNNEKVYVAGFSLGGFMTNKLACELGDRITAIASVSGTMSKKLMSQCTPSEPIPSLQIHSTNDGMVSYKASFTNLGAEELSQFWIKNNLANKTIDTLNLSKNVNDGFSAIKFTYKGKTKSNEVVLYRLAGPDHNQSWYTVSSKNDFDAINVIWDFFKEHNKNFKQKNQIKEVVISNNIHEVKIDVFPNPATDLISLNFANKIKLSSVSITNTLGKTIHKQFFEKAIDEVSFDVRNEFQGIYFFQIEDESGNKTVVRFYKK